MEVRSGDREHLTEFIEKGEEGKFTLQAYFPMPENPGEHLDDGKPHYMDAYTAMGGGDHEYIWKIKNWGTKWDVQEEGGTYLAKEGETVPVSSTTMEIDNGKITVSFVTAWGPPEAAIREISKRNPSLLFKLIFVEFGHGSAGTLVYIKGRPITFEEGDPEEYAERYDFSHAY